MLADRVAAFIRSPLEEEFDPLALEAFAYQYQRIEPYRRLCDRQGATPASIDDWSQVPAVPALAFKSLELTAAEPRETFRSSGTTGASRSIHRHPFPDLYRLVIESTFPSSLLKGSPGFVMLSLLPTREQAPDSSLSFMVDHVLRTWGAADSVVAFGPQGIEARTTRSFLAARQRDRRPALVLTTAFALVQLLESLTRLDLRFRLPPGSRIFETGGYKGRARDIDRAGLLAQIEERLAVRPEAVVREYGMTELTSHFYTRALDGGDPDLFLPPAWTRLRILDPETLEESPKGKTGLISVFDLANIGSAVHLLTEDLGVAEGNGFRLIGRAAGAELRGCSLTVEELSGT
jgi:hypothetical protein